LSAREVLGWTTEEFFDATPRFFSEMINAKTKSVKERHGDKKEKQQSSKPMFWDEIKREVGI